MDTRIQVVAGAVAIALLAIVLDLVRRRRLLERYALLWMLASLVLLGLAVWRELLDQVALALGVAFPPNALFVIALGFVLLLLLHFSVAVSRLSDQTKILAQRVALLEDRVRQSDAQPPPTDTRNGDATDEETRRREMIGAGRRLADD
jgi:hypothetical protein